jgi:hypothetical protein
MHQLPDGSGFFIGTVGGPRDPGLLPWLKYTPNNRARRWLFVWRMYRTARWLSRLPGQGPPLGHWRALRYALRCP